MALYRMPDMRLIPKSSWPRGADAWWLAIYEAVWRPAVWLLQVGAICWMFGTLMHILWRLTGLLLVVAAD